MDTIKLTPRSPHHVLYTSYNVPPSTNCSGEEVLWLLCQPVLHRLLLPPHPNWNDVNIQRLLGTKRNENRWVPNPMNMTDGITPLLNPEFASRYNRLYAVRRCQAAGGGKKKPRRFLRNCWLKLFPEHITVPFTVHCLSLLQLTFHNQVMNGRVILRIVYNFSRFHFTIFVQCTGTVHRTQNILQLPPNFNWLTIPAVRQT